MTKRLNSKHKVDRRLKVNLWGRPKSPFNTRAYPPGQHGQTKAGKPSDYGIQLQAKQKLKSYYGNMNERQFRNVYKKAIMKKGDTAENGKIVGALIDDHEGNVKRIRRKGKTIALESANRNYETKIFGPDRVKVQGVLVSLYRNF